MIGIDIVDLNDPRLKERDQTTLRLIKAIDDVIPSHPSTFWLLWTAKETVFKANRVLEPFKPKDISIEFDKDTLTFRSIYKSMVYHGKSIISDNYILSYCHPPAMLIEFDIIQNKNGNWPQYIRDFLLRKFLDKNMVLSIEHDELNLPMIKPQNLPISFSHHHQMGAYIHPQWIS